MGIVGADPGGGSPRDLVQMGQPLCQAHRALKQANKVRSETFDI